MNSGNLADSLGDHVVLYPEGVVLVTSPGTKSLYPRHLQSLKHFHVEYAYSNSVSTTTGLALDKIHIGRLPRPPLAVFDRYYGGAYHSLNNNHLAYYDSARERQQRA